MKKKLSVGKAVLMISQIGISMIVPIFLGAFIGYQLDRWLKTGFFFLVFLMIGILAAFRNIYLLTKPFYESDLKREQKEQEYWNSLKSRKSEDSGSAGGQEEESAMSGAAVRREREKFAEERKQREAGSADEVKDRRQTAEEEFDAWRRRNGR